MAMTLRVPKRIAGAAAVSLNNFITKPTQPEWLYSTLLDWLPR
jgi:hypothetical protein